MSPLPTRRLSLRLLDVLKPLLFTFRDTVLSLSPLLWRPRFFEYFGCIWAVKRRDLGQDAVLVFFSQIMGLSHAAG